MKEIMKQLYWEALNDLDKIKKSRLMLSERIGLEKAIVKMELIKRLLDKIEEK